MKKELNPSLSVGDRVTLIGMDDYLVELPLGESGIVKKVHNESFTGDLIYEVSWDNGDTLNLLSDQDIWIKGENTNISENISPTEDVCNSFNEGSNFCKKLSKILQSGRGGTGSRTLKDEAIKFFKQLLHGDFIGLGNRIELKPGVKLFDDRQNELKKFYKKLKKYNICKKMRLDVKKDIKNVEDKKLKMVVDNDENYSVLNRIDTHYTVRSFILTKAALLKNESGKSIDELSELEIIDFVLKIILNYEKNKLVDRDSLEFIDNVIQYSLNDENENNIIISNLEKTRSIGNQIEDEVANLLRQKKYKVFQYGQDYGFVDNFGVDMLVLKNGILRPVQVSRDRKSNPKFYKYNDSDCECWAIFKTKDGYRKEIIFNNNTMINESENLMDKAFSLHPIIVTERRNNFNIYKFLKALRDSAIMNMFQSPPFTIYGKDYLENYIKIETLRGNIDLSEDEIENLLELSELCKNNMINATIMDLEEKNIEITLDNVNRGIVQLSRKILEYFSLKLST
jgi:hypothetical protein